MRLTMVRVVQTINQIIFAREATPEETAQPFHHPKTTSNVILFGSFGVRSI